MTTPGLAPIRIGVISDTHDLLRPGAKTFLQGSDVIVHAGDICEEAVLSELSSIAPVIAVRGNNDKGAWAGKLRTTELFQAGEVFIYVIHDLAEIDIDPVAAGIRVVVSGHSHKPKVEEKEGILFLNPGSAGPRRFKLPVSAAEISVLASAVSARTVELE